MKHSVVVAVARAFVMHQSYDQFHIIKDQRVLKKQASSLEKPSSKKKDVAQVDELKEVFAVAEERFKRSWSQLPDWDLLIPLLSKEGWERIDEACQITPGVPVRPMLGRITRELDEVIDRYISSFQLAWKRT